MGRANDARFVRGHQIFETEKVSSRERERERVCVCVCVCASVCMYGLK